MILWYIIHIDVSGDTTGLIHDSRCSKLLYERSMIVSSSLEGWMIISLKKRREIRLQSIHRTVRASQWCEVWWIIDIWGVLGALDHQPLVQPSMVHRQKHAVDHRHVILGQTWHVDDPPHFVDDPLRSMSMIQSVDDPECRWSTVSMICGVVDPVSIMSVIQCIFCRCSTVFGVSDPV